MPEQVYDRGFKREFLKTKYFLHFLRKYVKLPVADFLKESDLIAANGEHQGRDFLDRRSDVECRMVSGKFTFLSRWSCRQKWTSRCRCGCFSIFPILSVKALPMRINSKESGKTTSLRRWFRLYFTAAAGNGLRKKVSANILDCHLLNTEKN